jgi:hypothetical protein
MKKINLLFTFLLLSIINIYAQEHEPEINIGANLGITTNHNTQIVVGLDGELLYQVDNNFKVGVATGLIFATENNGVLLPLAFSGRFKADTKFNLGLDLGYALPINNSSGSLYVRPMVEYRLSRKSNLKFSYSGLNSDGYLNVGIIFRLNHNKRSITISY